MTATLSVGFTPHCTSGSKTVTPPQSKGPVVFASSACGIGLTHIECARTRVANAP